MWVKTNVNFDEFHDNIYISYKIFPLYNSDDLDDSCRLSENWGNIMVNISTISSKVSTYNAASGKVAKRNSA